VIGFFSCPFCSCEFCSEADLASHLACFSKKVDIHRRLMRHAHYDIETSLWHEHGGADKAMYAFVDAFWQYVDYCSVSGKKVYALK